MYFTTDEISHEFRHVADCYKFSGKGLKAIADIIESIPKIMARQDFRGYMDMKEQVVQWVAHEACLHNAKFMK